MSPASPRSSSLRNISTGPCRAVFLGVTNKTNDFNLFADSHNATLDYDRCLTALATTGDREHVAPQAFRNGLSTFGVWASGYTRPRRPLAWQ